MLLPVIADGRVLIAKGRLNVELPALLRYCEGWDVEHATAAVGIESSSLELDSLARDLFPAPIAACLTFFWLFCFAIAVGSSFRRLSPFVFVSSRTSSSRL